jgi:DUF1009 family protein
MSIAATMEEPTLPGLGIIAGAGALPRTLMRACAQSNRPFFVIALEGAADEETVTMAGDYCAWSRVGAVGKIIDLFHEYGVSEIVLAGKVARPKITSLRPDLKGTKLLARVGGQLVTGDNDLVNNIIQFIEEEGFKVVGADQVMQDLLAPEGLIGSIYPDKRAQADIEFGARIAREIGALDIGQAVIVQNNVVLGVEAVEGTDGLIERCGTLKTEEKGGVLVKVKKPQQDSRVDLPTIGIPTIERVAAAGLAGLAVEAGATLMLDRRELARRADQLGVFVIGFSILE